MIISFRVKDVKERYINIIVEYKNRFLFNFGLCMEGRDKFALGCFLLEIEGIKRRELSIRELDMKKYRKCQLLIWRGIRVFIFKNLDYPLVEHYDLSFL
jgi:hypothetical protein